jgi:hypothetical protein
MTAMFAQFRRRMIFPRSEGTTVPSRDSAERISCAVLVAHGSADMLLIGSIAARYLDFLDGAIPAPRQSK